MSRPCRKLRTARYTGLKSSVMLPLVVSTTLRWITDRMAIGHSTERSTVAVPGALVGGRNAASRPVRRESAAVTSAPYTGSDPGLDGSGTGAVKTAHSQSCPRRPDVPDRIRTDMGVPDT